MSRTQSTEQDWSRDPNGPSSYNGFSQHDRYSMMPWYNKARRQGLLPKKTHCLMCSQPDGLLEYHSEDYNKPYVPECCKWGLCFRCHRLIHMRHKYLAAWKEYHRLILAGYRLPPLRESWNGAWKIFWQTMTNPATIQSLAVQVREPLTDDPFLPMFLEGEQARVRREQLGPVAEQPDDGSQPPVPRAAQARLF